MLEKVEKLCIKWGAYRNTWHKSAGNEETAFIKHYVMKHPDIINNPASPA